MLQKLQISNYAIIEEIVIDFSSQLNIITGETGAGKSILTGALSLILGERAETGVLLQKDKKCFVEGIFQLKKESPVKTLLHDFELDITDELVLRREIAASGKSRAFVNDTPVNLGQLKAISSQLVDLHQQFDTLELGDHDFQREVVDAMAGNTALLKEYQQQYAAYTSTQKKVQVLLEEQAKAKAMLDYNQFLFDELDQATLKENELEELDAELKLLSHAEEVKQALGGIYYALAETDTPMVQQLKSLAAKLQSLRVYHPQLEELGNRLQAVQIELDDIASGIDQANSDIRYDPERMQVINDKMSLGYRLLKKHNVLTTAELLAIRSSLEEKLAAVAQGDDNLQQLEKESANLLRQCEALAVKLSAARKSVAVPLATQVNALLKQVGMPNAVFKVDIAETTLGAFGKDNTGFLFDANKTGHFEPLHKVASGGELSRLMLCVKSLVAKKLALPTLIFDEIDTGISGEAAKQVGIIMKELASGHQLLAITHQPQIAARATAHYFVYKAQSGAKINTAVRLLNEEERINAIAQMLGGETPSAAALQNAREMVLQ